MNVTQQDIKNLLDHLSPWQGGRVSFNAFHDDHDRLTLSLQCPKNDRPSVGMTLFYCTYISGPVSWLNSSIDASLYQHEDGSIGVEISDTGSGFVARCSNIYLYGDPELIIPRS